MNHRQVASDMVKKILHSGTPEKERIATAMRLARYLDEHKLLAPPKSVGDRIADAASRATDPGFIDEIADKAERVVGGLDRIAGIGARVASHPVVAAMKSAKKASEGGRGRRRTYRGR